MSLPCKLMTGNDSASRSRKMLGGPPRRVVPIHGRVRYDAGLRRQPQAQPTGDERDRVVVLDVRPKRVEEQRVRSAATSPDRMPPRLPDRPAHLLGKSQRNPAGPHYLWRQPPAAGLPKPRFHESACLWPTDVERQPDPPA